MRFAEAGRYPRLFHRPLDIALRTAIAGATVVFVEEIRKASFKRRTKGQPSVVMASDIISKGLGLGPQPASDVGDDSAATIIELSGVIKWFDVSKGFGFIVPDNGLPDILLHVTCLRRDGFQTAYEGARIVAEVLQRPKGLQCFRILSMDESTAIHPSTLPPPRTHVSVTPTSGLERAIVKWFNRLRGFGFLTRGEGTPDIFVHMETLRRFGIAELRPGQTVLVRYGPGPKGMMAAEVQPEGGPHGPASH
jgi:CspA family cold shock protein